MRGLYNYYSNMSNFLFLTERGANLSRGTTDDIFPGAKFPENTVPFDFPRKMSELFVEL